MASSQHARATLNDFAAEAGIDGLAVTDASPLHTAGRRFTEAVGQGFIPRALAPGKSAMAKLTEPARHLRRARSVIVAYESYDASEPDVVDPESGTIAPYTRSNYYYDLKQRLLRLADFMQRELRCRTKTFSCYVTLTEKPLAQRAGLGFYGKNGVIATPNHGSFVVLGEIISDAEIDPDDPLDADCGSCRLCIDCCPTGAIRAPYMVDRNLCIQHISERSGVVPPPIREKWGKRLYGCSTCLEVCPLNAGLSPTGRKVSHGRVGASVPLAEMLLIDEQRFLARFGDNQIGMRERNAIRRNAIIAAGNSRSANLVNQLSACCEDHDPEIRQHALWALFRIGGSSARPQLERALRSETDVTVNAEIKTLLDGFM